MGKTKNILVLLFIFAFVISVALMILHTTKVANEKKISETDIVLIELPDDLSEGESLITESGCMICHQDSSKSVGPSWDAINERYKGDLTQILNLTMKVKNGGKGQWGEIAMTNHSHLKSDDIQLMIAWILSRKSNESDPKK
ncbi:MAG: c-type cytochrome [Lentisphaeria bacterium]|nr:c-type cytochrome [Lentisphaeria bacterium]NQZ69560.1 c-type cytochrome [Lentisphaeria bacterium]